MTAALTPQAFKAATDTLKTEARPLERAQYLHEYFGGSVEAIMTALAAYQNPDGGFGHALEPDVRLVSSSVIATTIAFQIFRQFNVHHQHPMVEAACEFLKVSYDAEHRNWSNVPPFVDDAPHAPWWTFRDQVRTEFANPRAEIVGHMVYYGRNFDSDLTLTLAKAALDHLEAQPDEIEMHDILCYVRLVETPALYPQIKNPMIDKLRRVIDHSVARSPKQWQAYGLQPTAVVTSPGSPFADVVRDVLDANLDFVIESQGEDGAWHPNFSWGGEHPEVWKQAEREWTGVLTLNTLRLLRAFGRIA
jgi:hypothetical protein